MKKKKKKMKWKGKKGKYLRKREADPPRPLRGWQPVRVDGRQERPLQLEAPETMRCTDKSGATTHLGNMDRTTLFANRGV